MTLPDTAARAPSGASIRPLSQRRGLGISVRWLVALTIVIAAAAGCWAIFFSSWLAAHRVDVTGTQTLSPDDVVAAADVPLGTPLLRIDLGAVEARVASLPAVARVTVHRDWPSAVVVQVVERQPVASTLVARAWWAVDAEGVLIRPLPRREDTLPVVTARGPMADRESVRAEATQVLAALPASLLDSVHGVSATSMDSVMLHLDSGRLVEWGSSTDSTQKADVLALLMEQAPAAVYDVSVPALPTTSRNP